MAEGTVHHIAVTRTERREDELPEILSLPGLGIVLHSHMIGVELVAWNVREQLRKIQPPQELHRVVSGRKPREAHVGGSLLKLSPAPCRPTYGQQMLPVAFRINRVLKKLAQVPRTPRATEGLGGEGGEARRRGLSGGFARGVEPVGNPTGGIERNSMTSLLTVLPICRLSARQFLTGAAVR